MGHAAGMATQGSGSGLGGKSWLVTSWLGAPAAVALLASAALWPPSGQPEAPPSRRAHIATLAVKVGMDDVLRISLADWMHGRAWRFFQAGLVPRSGRWLGTRLGGRFNRQS